METKKAIEATCPECRGPLSEVREDGLRQYRCLVGHVYSAAGLLAAHSETQEKQLWAAVVVLEEATSLVEATLSQFPPEVAASLRRQAEEKRRQAQAIRKILEELQPFQIGEPA